MLSSFRIRSTIRVSGFRTCSVMKAAISSTIRRNTTVKSVWIFTYSAIFADASSNSAREDRIAQIELFRITADLLFCQCL